jgi:glycolate oxidase
MASFDDVVKAGDAVAKHHRRRHHPGRPGNDGQPATAAVEEFVRAGYDLDAEAILLCEADGTPEEVAEEIARMRAVLRKAAPPRSASRSDEAERLKFWAGRKAAFPAAGRISPDYYCMDGTIPRKRLGEMLHRIQAMEGKYGLRCPNVFHAGDGNLHPLILFDANQPGELERAEAFGAEILELSVERSAAPSPASTAWGSRRSTRCARSSRPPELRQFFRVKAAFDPPGLLNPGKAIPTLQPLRRVRAHEGEQGPRAVSRHPALLNRVRELRRSTRRLDGSCRSAGRREPAPPPSMHLPAPTTAFAPAGAPARNGAVIGRARRRPRQHTDDRWRGRANE